MKRILVISCISISLAACGAVDRAGEAGFVIPGEPIIEADEPGRAQSPLADQCEPGGDGIGGTGCPEP